MKDGTHASIPNSLEPPSPKWRLRYSFALCVRVCAARAGRALSLLCLRRFEALSRPCPRDGALATPAQRHGRDVDSEDAVSHRQFLQPAPPVSGGLVLRGGSGKRKSSILQKRGVFGGHLKRSSGTPSSHFLRPIGAFLFRIHRSINALLCRLSGR